MMSAALAVRLEEASVGACLCGDGFCASRVPVLGHGDDPHAWLMIGARLSTLPSSARPMRLGPPRLARHVDLVFGPNRRFTLTSGCARRAMA
jgi:hypothetical protein